MNKGGTQHPIRHGAISEPSIGCTDRAAGLCQEKEHYMNINIQGHSMHIDTADNARIFPPVHSGRPAPRARQPWGRLLKAVLELAGDRAELLGHAERDWTSATFSGSRHAISLCFTGSEAVAAGELFIAALPGHEFVIPRYLIADAQVSSVDDTQLPERELVVEVQLFLIERA